MPTVVSLLSRDRFASARPDLPAGLSTIFLERITPQEIVKACADADCLFSPATAGPLGPDVLENIPRIRIIQTLGVGFDHIDLPATVRLGIPVANMPGANATCVAEHTIGSIIALQRRFVETDAATKDGDYVPGRNRVLAEGLTEIRGSRIGLVGFGNIARQVAKIALFLGAAVSYCATRRQPPEVERQFPVKYRTLDELLATSDVVSLHVPLGAKTRGMIGKRELALMPTGSLLVNTARGEITDQAALAAALETGHLAGAAIDTIAPEPPPPDHPLLRLSAAAKLRLLLTPHTAGVTVGSYRRMLEGAFANMDRVMRGETPQNVVNGVLARKG
jgi:phosphoglycerate dehydrogenase-like enzyme